MSSSPRTQVPATTEGQPNPLTYAEGEPLNDGTVVVLDQIKPPSSSNGKALQLRVVCVRAGVVEAWLDSVRALLLLFSPPPFIYYLTDIT